MFKNKFINVFEPEINQDDINFVVKNLRKKNISGTSKIISEFEEKFAKFVGTKYAVSVTSGTAALFLAVKILNLKNNDEILVSNTTNIATALAVYHNSGKLVPVDSEINSWNLDLNLLEKKITKKTKLILPVHFLGKPIDMDRLMWIAKKHDLIVIEDAAEAHGATWKNKKVGSFGDMSCFSFYANKTITTGEGGMICTNNKNFRDKLRLLRNLGFQKPRFIHKIGAYNFRMSGMQAALGISQLRKINKFIDLKREIAREYEKNLKDTKGLKLVNEDKYEKHVYWMIGVLLDKNYKMKKNKIIKKLYSKGIDTRDFFYPINRQPFLIKEKRLKNIKCPVSYNLWKNGFYLPSSLNLTKKQIKEICGMLK